MKSCAFTGHRTLGNEVTRERLKEQIERLVNEGIDTFLCGLARGFDMLAGELVVELKQTYPHLRLIGCIPFLGQEDKFPFAEKQRYYRLKEQCDERVVLLQHYASWSFHARNDYMCRNADMAFAYLTKQTGGTAYTVKAFLKADKRVVYYTP